MTKAEKAWFRKTLGIIDRSLKSHRTSLKAHGGSLVILGNQLEQLSTDIKNLKLVVEETQEQQRRGSGTMRVAPNVKTAPSRKR
jgi:hypothetical protein